MSRSIVYRNHQIYLRPVAAVGVRAQVESRPNARTGYTYTLYETTFLNHGPTRLGQHTLKRSSAELAALGLKHCQEWIDARVELEAGINTAVEAELGRVAE